MTLTSQTRVAFVHVGPAYDASMKPTNVLIVDGPHRIGLAVARSLRLGGSYTIHLVGHQKGWSDSVFRAFKSNAVDSIHFMRIDSADDSFLYRLRRLIEDKKIDFLIPAGHDGTLHVAFLKKTLERLCTVLAPDYETILPLHDKRETMCLAKRIGIPHPITVVPQSDAEAEKYAGICKYPAVVKARKGTEADGVWYARNSRELMQAYRRAEAQSAACDRFSRDTSFPMIQEYIPGELHDVAIFCLKGDMKACLTQQRVLTKPLSGGKGIVNATTCNLQLMDQARKLVEHLGWDGVLLCDFKIDSRDGTPKLLEVNPRFWGTTWLTTCAGLNFPHNLVLAAKGEPLRLPSRYPVGLKGRWLVYELGMLFEAPVSPGIILQRLKGFFSRFKAENTIYDTLWSDLKPLAADLITRSVWTWQGLGHRRGTADDARKPGISM